MSLFYLKLLEQGGDNPPVDTIGTNIKCLMRPLLVETTFICLITLQKSAARVCNFELESKFRRVIKRWKQRNVIVVMTLCQEQ